MTDVIQEIINNSTQYDAATIKQVLEKLKEPIVEKKTNSVFGVMLPVPQAVSWLVKANATAHNAINTLE